MKFKSNRPRGMYRRCSVPCFKFSLSETFASEYLKLLHGVLCLNEQIGEKAILKARLLKTYVYPHYLQEHLH